MLRFKSIVNNYECYTTVGVVGEDTNNMDTFLNSCGVFVFLFVVFNAIIIQLLRS